MPFSSTVVSAHRPTSLVLSFLVGKMAGNHRRRQGVEGEVLRPELAPSTCSGSGDCYGCVGVTPGRVCGTQVLRSPAPPHCHPVQPSVPRQELLENKDCICLRLPSPELTRRPGTWQTVSVGPAKGTVGTVIPAAGPTRARLAGHRTEAAGGMRRGGGTREGHRGRPRARPASKAQAKGRGRIGTQDNAIAGKGRSEGRPAPPPLLRANVPA